MGIGYCSVITPVPFVAAERSDATATSVGILFSLTTALPCSLPKGADPSKGLLGALALQFKHYCDV